MPIIGTADERRGYDKDENLMSKSQFMSLRKKCHMPYKYRYVDGIKDEDLDEDDVRVIGTNGHTTVEGFFNNLIAKKFDINKHDDITPWIPEHGKRNIIHINNFMRQYCMITDGNYDMLPLYQEVVAQEGTEIGTLDQVWKMTDGSLAVVDIKTGKFKNNLADIRIETAFYARMIGAKWIGAFFLGESDEYPYGGFFFEEIKPQLMKRLEVDIEKTWKIRRTGAFERIPTILCSWCDNVKLCRSEMNKEEKKELAKQLRFSKQYR